MENFHKIDASPFNSFAARSVPIVFSGEGNECFSPLSLYMALSSVALGAKGNGREELLSLLDASDERTLEKICKEAYRLLCPPPKPKCEPKTEREKRMRDLFGDGDESEKIVLANSLWVNSGAGYSVASRYEKVFGEVMNGQVNAIDFSLDVSDKITAWADEATDGFLSPSVVLSPENQLAISNILYYKGAWSDDFSDRATKPDVFHSPDGDIRVDFMHDNDVDNVYDGDGFICARRQLGYCRMMFFLPDEGTDVEELVSTPDKVTELLSAEPNEKVMLHWSVPKFDIASKIEDLGKCVSALGAEQMFIPSRMFEDMIEGPDSDKTRVSQVSQDMRVKIDEKGCEAAAMTMVAFACFGMPSFDREVEFNLNRPFIFALTSLHGTEGDGIPLFMGIVRDPSKQ